MLRLLPSEHRLLRLLRAHRVKWAANCMLVDCCHLQPAWSKGKGSFQQFKMRLNAGFTAASLWQECHLANGAAVGAISDPLAADLQTK